MVFRYIKLDSKLQNIFIGLAVLAIIANITLNARIETVDIAPSPASAAVVKQQGSVSSSYKGEDTPKFGNFDKLDMYSKVKEEIRKEYESVILEQLKDEIKRRNEAKFIGEFKEKIQEEYTKNVFKVDQISMSMVNKFKSTFMKDNEYTLKSFITGDLFNALKNDDQFKDYLNNEKKANELINVLDAEIKKMNDIPVFFQHIFQDFIWEYDPKVKLESQQIGIGIDPKPLSNPSVLSYDHLTKDRVKLNDEQFTAMQNSHTKLVSLLNNFILSPNFGYSGDGIVINSDDLGIGSALVSIVQLREQGSKLPIELVLNKKDDSTNAFCELLKDRFNTQCIYIDQKLPFIEKDQRESLKKFQLKVIGILISSFDNVICLDADSLAIKNVDELIFSQDFVSTGFLLWPDFWEKTTSPLYYEIAGFQAGEPIRRFGLPNDGNFLEYIGKKKKTEISYHDLEGIPNARTSETGQMVISKSRHFRALVLALYYNYYGPDTYYPLFYQGGAGEGDKDTFIPALEVFQEPYTVVDKDPLALGFKSGPNMDGDFVETTITQYAPTSAKYHLKAWKQWLNQKDLDTRLWPYQSNEYTKKLYDEFMEDFKKTKLEDNSMVLEPMFLHAHKPKINPFVNYENKMGILEKRNFGSLESLRTIFGDDKDWELRLHAVSKWVVCEGFTDNKYYEKQDRKEICEKITNYVDYLKKTTTVANFDYLKVDSEDFNNKIKQTDDGDNESPKDKEEDKSNNDNKDTKDTEDTEKE